MERVDLQCYNSSYYHGNLLKRIIWYIINLLFFKSSLPYPYSFKIALLKIFGCRVGKNIIIKPNVNIKYPWYLVLGDNVWIGEGVWIDNLAEVRVGNNVCISQGAYICTANHNYKKVSFDLILKPIVIDDGVWICNHVIVCPGVKLGTHSVILSGSVITKDTEPYGVYQGNPAKMIRIRKLD